MDIIVDPNTQHIVTITPGRPLTVGGVEIPRATAECSQGDFFASGTARVVIEDGAAHSDNHQEN